MTQNGIIEGGGNRFPSTLWSLIGNVGDKDMATRQAAWETLASKYWRPIHAYVRAHWREAPGEAIDLTQDFSVWMLESGFLSKADVRRGRFRAFVKCAIESYLKMEVRARGRLKRGGGKRFFGIEGAEDFSGLTSLTPESAFESAWKRELLTRATTLLQEFHLGQGKGTYFDVFKGVYLDESPKSSHEEIARRLGIRASDVNNYIMDAKRRFREILKDLVAETVGESEDLQSEYRELFGEEA